MPWYSGRKNAAGSALETAEIRRAAWKSPTAAFPGPVLLTGSNLDFAWFSGTVASRQREGPDKAPEAGTPPSGVESSVCDSIVTLDGDPQEAGAGEAITIPCSKD